MQLPPADLQKLRTSLTEDVQTITQNYGNLKVSVARKYACTHAIYSWRSRADPLLLVPVRPFLCSLRRSDGPLEVRPGS